jgi:hypothetical protein
MSIGRICNLVLPQLLFVLGLVTNYSQQTAYLIVHTLTFFPCGISFRHALNSIGLSRMLTQTIQAPKPSRLLLLGPWRQSNQS